MNCYYQFKPARQTFFTEAYQHLRINRLGEVDFQRLHLTKSSRKMAFEK